jgi:VIT1/CCC1 family predicted Fe2+/Mn2+ transporter
MVDKQPQLKDEPISGNSTNSLRAAVLGANDGIISVAALVVGVGGAIADAHTILISGIAGLVAGAFSMGAGEYVSVSSQRDTEKALLEKERRELELYPKEEHEELVSIYEEKGLSRKTAEIVASELASSDTFMAHADAELNIDPRKLTSPWHAAFASFISFTIGGIIPLLAIVFFPEQMRIVGTFISVVIALMITGILSARASGAPAVRAVSRIVISGFIAMLVTYGVGVLFGVSFS